MASPFNIDSIEQRRAPVAATDFVYVGCATSILSVLLDEVIPSDYLTGRCLLSARGYNLRYLRMENCWIRPLDSSIFPFAIVSSYSRPFGLYYVVFVLLYFPCISLYFTSLFVNCINFSVMNYCDIYQGSCHPRKIVFIMYLCVCHGLWPFVYNKIVVL
jgi:hypothetical protein